MNTGGRTVTPRGCKYATCSSVANVGVGRNEIARPRAGSHDADARLDHTRTRLDADTVLVIDHAPHTHVLADFTATGRAQRPQHGVGREHT